MRLFQGIVYKKISGGNLQMSVFQDFDELRAYCLAAVSSDRETKLLLHASIGAVGSLSGFEEVSATSPGVYFTTPLHGLLIARLKDGVLWSPHCVGIGDSTFRVALAVKGWGYELSTPEGFTEDTVDTRVQSSVEQLATSSPAQTNVPNTLYSENADFSELVGVTLERCGDVKLATLDLGTRLSKRFASRKLTHLSDIWSWTDDDVLSLNGLGVNSLSKAKRMLLLLIQRPAVQVGFATPQRIHGHYGGSDVVSEYGFANHEEFLNGYWELSAERRATLDHALAERGQQLIAKDDPVSLLMYLPPWILDMKPEELGSPRRAIKAIQTIGSNCLRDLLHGSSWDLHSQRNFGPTTAVDLSARLIELVHRGPADDAFRVRLSAAVTPLSGHVKRLLEGASERDRLLLTRRMWVANSEQATLEALANDLGITRERVRQLESSLASRILEDALWDEYLLSCLSKVSQSRMNPMYLDILGIEEKWLEGFESQLGLLAGIIEMVSDEEWKCWRLEGRLVMARVTASELRRAQGRVRSDIERRLNSGEVLGVDDLATSCERILLDCRASEFCSYLLAKLKAEAVFDSTGSTIVSIASNVSDQCVDIIVHAGHPLHHTLVLRMLAESGVSMEERQVLSALQRSRAIPFGYGVYGLPEHVGVDEVELDVLGQSLAEQVRDHPSRSWHSSELLESVLDEDLQSCLTPSLIDWLLRDQPDVERVGRSLWQSKVRTTTPSVGRARSIQEEAVAVLVAAGGPVCHADLIRRIRSRRGLGAYATVFPDEQIARTAPGIYGLRARDFPFGLRSQAEYLDALNSRLSSVGCLAFKDIFDAVSCTSFDVKSYPVPYHLVAIAQSDPRFRVSRSYSITLTNSAFANDDILETTVANALKTCGGMARLEYLQTEASKTLGWEPTVPQMRSVFSELGLAFDTESEYVRS